MKVIKNMKLNEDQVIENREVIEIFLTDFYQRPKDSEIFCCQIDAAIDPAKKEKRTRSVELQGVRAYTKNAFRRRRLRAAVRAIIRSQDVYEEGFASLFSESGPIEQIDEKVI
ncbi:hypothetical protein HK098_005997 [Nowakowskiella sp. JEL0407]|nr:hypothetical protein HK098_005997 [Nowakowskiella sp. JEL0407]